MILNKLQGRATGIGSLPHRDPGEALELVFDTFKEIPHWPQLPRRGSVEGLARQYLANLLRRNLISIRPNGTPYFCLEDPGWEKRCLEYYELLLSGDDDARNREFAFTGENAAGFHTFVERCSWGLPPEALCLKGQVTGPVTVGFMVTDPAGKPAFYIPSLREIIVKTLAAAARWQVEQLKTFGLPAVLFVDEPALYNYGTSTAVGLGRPEIEASMEEIFSDIRSAGGVVGMHSCAGNDWSLVAGLPLDIMSFDAYEYFSSLLVYSDHLNPFFERGGLLAWGIVPSSEKVRSEKVSSLERLLVSQREALFRRGVDENHLQSRYLLTPSCGTGTLSPDLAARIYYLTASLTDRIA